MIAFFLLVGLLLPQLIRSIVTFSQNFDSYTQSLKQLIENSPLKTIIDEENMELINQNVMSAISGYVKEAADNAISIAASTGKNIISTVIGSFILLLAGPGNTVLFLVFCLLLQSVDAYILKPKLFSSALGVSGVAILISTIVLGNMFGILGVLLAIPAAAILSFAYHEYFMKSKKRPRRKPRSTEPQ